MIAPLANDQSIDRSGLGQRHTSTILHATVRLPKARRGETAATKSARNILFRLAPSRNPIGIRPLLLVCWPLLSLN